MRKHIVIDQPTSLLTSPMSSTEDFFKQVADTGFLAIDVRNHTKTRLHVSIRNGSFSFGINMVSRKFKTHNERSFNVWTNEPMESNYFKVLKAQRREQVIEYVNEQLDTLKFPHDIELRFFNTKTLKEL